MAKINLIKYISEKEAEAGFFSDPNDKIPAVISYEADDCEFGFSFEVGETLAAGAARFEREVAFNLWFEENMFSSYEKIGVAAPIDDNGKVFTVVDDFVSNGKHCMSPAAYAAGMELLKDYAVCMVDLEFQFAAGIPEELVEALQCPGEPDAATESSNEEFAEIADSFDFDGREFKGESYYIPYSAETAELIEKYCSFAKKAKEMKNMEEMNMKEMKNMEILK